MSKRIAAKPGAVVWQRVLGCYAVMLHPGQQGELTVNLGRFPYHQASLLAAFQKTPSCGPDRGPLFHSRPVRRRLWQRQPPPADGQLRLLPNAERSQAPANWCHGGKVQQTAPPRAGYGAIRHYHSQRMTDPLGRHRLDQIEPPVHLVPPFPARSECALSAATLVPPSP